MKCEWCPNPTNQGGTTCYLHKQNSTGNGNHINCHLCHKPQKHHKRGYPEHTQYLQYLEGKRHTP